MASFTADTAAVEIGAGSAKTAGGCAGPAEAELSAIGGEHGVLALGSWGEFHNRFPCDSDFGFAVGWEMVWSTTLKAMGALPLAWRLG